MRTTQTMTISLPPKIMEELDIYRQKNNYTRSELVRHALRELFFSRFPRYTPTKAEAKRIEEGRREIQKGNYITWEEMRGKLGYKNRAKSKKGFGVAAR